MSVMYNLEASKQASKQARYNCALFVNTLKYIFIFFISIGKVATMFFRRAMSVAFAF